jgi:hypothetical protein
MIRRTAMAAANGRARLRRLGRSESAAASSGGTTIVSSTVGTPSRPDSVSSSSTVADSTACACSVIAVSAGSSSETSKKTTVMLSSPPPRFAATTSAFAASSRLPRCFSIAWMIVWSSTMSVSPSEQMRNRSPDAGSIEKVSTSTSASVPTARVMTERCGCASASSGVSLPLRTSSATSE